MIGPIKTPGFQEEICVLGVVLDSKLGQLHRSRSVSIEQGENRSWRAVRVGLPNTPNQ